MKYLTAQRAKTRIVRCGMAPRIVKTSGGFDHRIGGFGGPADARAESYFTTHSGEWRNYGTGKIPHQKQSRGDPTRAATGGVIYRP